MGYLIFIYQLILSLVQGITVLDLFQHWSDFFIEGRLFVSRCFNATSGWWCSLLWLSKSSQTLRGRSVVCCLQWLILPCTVAWIVLRDTFSLSWASLFDIFLLDRVGQQNLFTKGKSVTKCCSKRRQVVSYLLLPMPEIIPIRSYMLLIEQNDL